MLSSDARSTACVSFDGRFQQELLQGDRCVCVRPEPCSFCRRSLSKNFLLCACVRFLDCAVGRDGGAPECIGFLFLGADGCLGIFFIEE